MSNEPNEDEIMKALSNVLRKHPDRLRILVREALHEVVQEWKQNLSSNNTSSTQSQGGKDE